MNTKDCEWCGKKIEKRKPSFAKKCNSCCNITSIKTAYEMGYRKGFQECIKKKKLSLVEFMGMWE